MTPRGLVALVAIAALALLLRVAAPERDVPRLVEETNAPALDAFWYLEAAQSAADGSACEPHDAYDRPLWVALARGWFRVFGTGVASSHALGGALGALTVLLLGLALRPLGERAALASAALLAASFPFVGLARTPLIYGPIGATLALAWAVHARGGAGRPLAFALALLATVLGKGVAIVGVAGLVAAEVARSERVARRASLALLALAVIGLLAARFDPTHTWERNAERASRYLALELREPGLHVGAVLERLLVVPWESRLAPLAPALVGLALLGTLLAVRDRAALSRDERATLALALGWLVPLLAALAVLDYRPFRYFTLAGPPLAALAGWAVARVAAPASGRAPVARGVVGAFALASALAALRARLVSSGGASASRGLVAVGSAALAPVTLLVLGRRAPLASGRVALVAIVIAAGLSLDAVRVLELLRSPASLARAAEAARAALGPRAVLAGPYAPLLAAGSRLERRRATDLTGGPRAAEGIAVASSRGYTHVALDLGQERMGQLGAGFARAGERPELIAAFAVRGDLVLLFRLARTPGYELSPFERACAEGPAGVAELAAPVELKRARARALRLLGRADEARALERALPPE